MSTTVEDNKTSGAISPHQDTINALRTAILLLERHPELPVVRSMQMTFRWPWDENDPRETLVTVARAFATEDLDFTETSDSREAKVSCKLDGLIDVNAYANLQDLGAPEAPKPTYRRVLPECWHCGGKGYGTDPDTGVRGEDCVSCGGHGFFVPDPVAVTTEDFTGPQAADPEPPVF